MSQAVQVNDAVGIHMTNVVGGETINVALQRLAPFGTGVLEDKNGIALLNSDLITADGAPYVFKPQQQQPSAGSNLPPLSPHKRHKPEGTAPTSTGKTSAKMTQPRKAPSSDEGNVEGLDHASIEDKSNMHCTSNPACVALLQILESILKDKGLDTKFHTAARHVLKARLEMSRQGLPNQMGSNERFYTGAMAIALNSVLEDGYGVLHQGCIGTGATHSDLSGTRLTPEAIWPPTLMVGEGKWLTNNLRNETRGQILNELLRHRKLDAEMSNGADNGPILLLAFDKSHVEIDLAFPSKFSGKLANDEVVEFTGNFGPTEEMFWTVRILRIGIDGDEGGKNLPIVFRFIAEGMAMLHGMSRKERVQHKIPFPLTESNKITAVSQYCGANVSIIQQECGSVFVFKEYCYHLREGRCPFAPEFTAIEKTDQRQPPSTELRNALGPPYSTEWKVHAGPLGTSVLQYPLLEGSAYSPSVKGWVMILTQVQAMHKINFVHGDLLERNVIFSSNGHGYLIDFDLSRKAGGRYVQGYNYKDFMDIRHREAQAGYVMHMTHDVHSLIQMSMIFFPSADKTQLGALDLPSLIHYFKQNPEIPSNEYQIECKIATGSPPRAQL